VSNGTVDDKNRNAETEIKKVILGCAGRIAKAGLQNKLTVNLDGTGSSKFDLC